MTGNEEAGRQLENGIVSYMNERAQNIIKYSDKLSKAIAEIDKYLEKVGGAAGIRFIDSEVFATDYVEPMGKISYKLMISGDQGLFVWTDCEYKNNGGLVEKSRYLKKEAIKRLPEFLRLFAVKLAEMEHEYEEISSKADKMATILSERKA